MLCNRCAKQIDDDALFCRFCGEKVAQNNAAVQEEAPVAQGENKLAAAWTVQPQAENTRLIMGRTQAEWKRMKYWEKIRACEMPMRWFIVLPIIMASYAVSVILTFATQSNAISMGSASEISIISTLINLAALVLDIAIFILLMRFGKLGFILLFVESGVRMVEQLVTMLFMPSTDMFVAMLSGFITVVFIFAMAIQGAYLAFNIVYYRERKHLFLD